MANYGVAMIVANEMQDLQRCRTNPKNAPVVNLESVYDGMIKRRLSGNEKSPRLGRFNFFKEWTFMSRGIFSIGNKMQGITCRPASALMP